jgi:hypothetical protein
VKNKFYKYISYIASRWPIAKVSGLHTVYSVKNSAQNRDKAYHFIAKCICIPHVNPAKRQTFSNLKGLLHQFGLSLAKRGMDG